MLCDSYLCHSSQVRTEPIARKMSNNSDVVRKTDNIYKEILMS